MIILLNLYLIVLGVGIVTNEEGVTCKLGNWAGIVIIIYDCFPINEVYRVKVVNSPKKPILVETLEPLRDEGYKFVIWAIFENKE